MAALCGSCNAGWIRTVSVTLYASKVAALRAYAPMVVLALGVAPAAGGCFFFSGGLLGRIHEVNAVLNDAEQP